MLKDGLINIAGYTQHTFNPVLFGRSVLIQRLHKTAPCIHSKTNINLKSIAKGSQEERAANMVTIQII